MKKFIYFITIFQALIILGGCSTMGLEVDEKLTFIKNKDDLISVSSAVDLARASYIRACILQMKECGLKPSFDQCLIKARSFINEDVIFILNQ